MNISNYANLNKYQGSNSDVRAEYPQGVSTVFIGDSITALWQQRRPEFFTKHNIIGRGISGQVTHQILLRFRDDVINLKPKVVVILAGTNDIAQNSGEVSLQTIANNIFSMAELAHYHGASVILCSILPAQDYPWRSGLAPAEKIADLNNIIKQYALEHNFLYVDYYSAMADEEGGLCVPKYTTAKDLVHPNNAGYAVMEALITPAIAAALKTPDFVILEISGADKSHKL